MSKRSDKAAAKLFHQLFPGVGWDYTDHKAKPLLRAAFALYESEWKTTQPQAFRIERWEWPAKAFKSDDPYVFDAHEPWTVLFREVKMLHDAHRETSGYPRTLADRMPR
ncbi:hypothetical protein KEU06_09340 [Pseudaminobacter sp. 19-2017]|uniref:Uncharacterized protein n=1 Tax=Pseudaminobacter soli (ex Zhang et al. 2022) TaxID=2831468 RepID=A0A942DX40_9HYPH|nr:hypothetical protein [Pseudaminobacter soli]MBS3648808.1 hypothetical protein [Pseudaminobacter soli]